MGKDQSGGFHPPKGKPSGSKKSEGLGVSTTPADEMEDYLERTDEYTIDDERIDPSIPINNPNRPKEKNTTPGRPNIRESDTTIELATDENVTTPQEELPVVTREVFSELAAFQSDCCITIYLPTHSSGVAVNEKQDAILLKNALKDVTAQLTDQGIETGRIKTLLTPGYELLQDHRFWGDMADGLAIFISDGSFQYYKMPVATEYTTICQKRFYMTPLLSAIRSDVYFYLLVISKSRCQLYRADATEMKPVHVPDLPDGVMAVKRISEKDASTVRVGTSSGTGGANFHGMAGGNPDDKDNIAVYFEAVDDILFQEIFHKENAPLLLAGVEYLIPIYRQACDYHNVCKEALTGSHEHDEIHSLHQKAMEIMAPLFKKAEDTALTIYANQSATPLTSDEPQEVIPGAFYSRVSHLFAAKNAQVWGAFDEASAALDLHAQPHENSENLLDMAIIKTLANGGEAYLLEPDQMPSGAPLAAVFRY